MAFDGLYLQALTKELQETLQQSRLDKVQQPEKNELILTFRRFRETHRVLLTSSSETARVHLSDQIKENPKEAPLFTMVLRKYLQGGKLLRVQQMHGDRIVFFTFLSSDELGFESTYHLIIEMMGRHSNILLVRERDMRIMECIKHVGHDQNTYRLLLPGATYVAPPPQKKSDPLALPKDWICPKPWEDLKAEDFSRFFMGISRKSAESLYPLYEQKRAMGKTPQQALFTLLDELAQAQKFYVVRQGEEPIDLLCFCPPALEELQAQDAVRIFDSPSQALVFFIGERDRMQRVRERAQDILRILSVNLERVEKKQVILQNVLEEAKDKESYRLKGELLKAHLYSIKQGAREVVVTNYFSEAQEEVALTLDPHRTPAENMQLAFKQYNKLKRSEEFAKEQLLLAQEELSYLQSVADSVLRSEDPSDLAEIRKELVVAGYLRAPSGKRKKESPSKPMHFRSTEGFDLYVGKNNNQNDALTLRLADGRDTWLHTKNYPGSHVIIKGEGFSMETLLEAANLAAWYSKAQCGSKVPVDYTLVRHVKKPHGAKPGMVIYSANKTLLVDPDRPRLDRL
ncbi:Fibronectin/fibrinogen-binding protein [Clostridiaceae bacterium JG1575]|nr:Fibronectin/fibrinogen-binding protein [Clostridiaceae bacterium JG1575]